MKNFVVSLVKVVGVGDMAKVKVTGVGLNYVFLSGKIAQVVLEV